MDDKRVQATIQFNRGQDDDLIDFISRYPKGTLNQVLKAALRHALATVGEIEVHQNGNGNGLDRRVAELEAMVSYLTSRIESSAFFYDVASQEPQVEAMPSLSEQEIQERKTNLKKAKW
jgi:hypothetical protein